MIPFKAMFWPVNLKKESGADWALPNSNNAQSANLCPVRHNLCGFETSYPVSGLWKPYSLDCDHRYAYVQTKPSRQFTMTKWVPSATWEPIPGGLCSNGDILADMDQAYQRNSRSFAACFCEPLHCLITDGTQGTQGCSGRSRKVKALSFAITWLESRK